MTPWFSRCDGEPLLKEIWQGKRWKELDYIWDPDRDFYLPDHQFSSVDEVYVIGFVPVCLLPHQNLDPFLKPFLKEIKIFL